MENALIDPWLSAYSVGLLLASIIIWTQLIARWRRGDTILEWEPRRAVPWGPIVAVPAIVFMLLTLSTPAETAAEPRLAPQNLFASMLVPTLAAAVVVAIAIGSGATAADLGLPTSTRQVGRDVLIGSVACFAAVAPVHGIQALLLYLLGREDPSRHPFVKMVTAGEPNLAILLLATVAAVMAAPICEEILYRLMLQGWLEKRETKRRAMPNPLHSGDIGTTAQVVDDARHPEPPKTSDEVAAPADLSSIVDLPPVPTRGWFAIVLTSAIFAAAHFGYGPEPIPIFLLSLILGYVYQRTHRIVPSIVAHALFNLLTVISLWRMVFHPPV
jgi:membrane protease YdiL (CAAX protease family)